MAVLVQRMLRKRKWAILIIPTLVGFATFLIADVPSPVFTARALVRVTNSPNPALFPMDPASGTDSKMATQQILVSSRPVLENVAKRLNMVKEGELPEDVFVELRGRVSAEQQANSDILAIRGSASSDAQAVVLTNSLVDAYIETAAANRNRNLAKTINLVRTRTNEARTELDDAERAMFEFRRTQTSTLTIDPGTLRELRERQKQYEEKLDGLKGTLETTNRIQRNRDYTVFQQSYLIIDDGIARSMADETQRLATAFAERSAERDELLRFQTEAAPQVVSGAAAIQSIERKLQTQLTALNGRLRDVIVDTQRRLNDTQSRESEAQRQPDLASQSDELSLDISHKQDALARLREQLQSLEIQETGKIEEVTVIESAHSAAQSVSRSRYYKTFAGVLLGFFIAGVLVFMLQTPPERRVAAGSTGIREMHDIMALTGDGGHVHTNRR